MCPVCLATLAIIAGTGTAGGVTALVVKKARAKPDEKNDQPPPSGQGGQ